jgi:hypothetical protein
MKRSNPFVWWALPPSVLLGFTLALHAQVVVERTVVTVTAPDPEAVEGSENTGLFVIHRRGNLDVPISVQLRITGTASNGVDYAALPLEVTVPAGVEEVPLEVKPIADELDEGVETVVLHVEELPCIAIWPPPPQCYAVGRPAEAVVRIYDAPDRFPPRVAIAQPEPGTVFRAPADVRVEVVARDPDGYVPRVEFFADGQRIGVREVFFLIPPPPGESQRFDWVWSNAPVGLHVLTAVATDDSGLSSTSAPVEIRVREVPSLPRVWIEAPDPYAVEPLPMTPGFDPARFVLRREGGDPGSPLTVRYRVGGTASNGVDYVELPGSVTFPSGAREVDLTIQPLPDDEVEDTESVVIQLVQPDCATQVGPAPGCYLVADPARAVAWIRDMTRTNRPPLVKLVSPPPGAVYQEPVDVRLVALGRDPDGWVVTVDFYADGRRLGTVTNQLAMLPEPDAELTPAGPVVPAHIPALPFVWVWTNVPAGEHQLVAVATDNLGARTESPPVRIRVLATTAPPVVRILATDPIAREGATNTARFQILCSRALNTPWTVYYEVGGTATPGEDYKELPGRAEIPAGARAVPVEVVAAADNLREGPETVVVRLIEPPVDAVPYRVGQPSRAAALILDAGAPVPREARLGDGTVGLLLLRLPGVPWRLEWSTNLVDWEVVGSCGTGADETLPVLDPDAPQVPMRFYRIVPEYGPADVNN